MKEKACRSCRYIVEGTTCPLCGNTNLSSDWSGYVVVRNVEDSRIAPKLNINKLGKYALKVR